MNNALRLIVFLTIPAPFILAQVDVKTYRRDISGGDNRQLIRTYLAGAANALGAANAELASNHQPRLYCAPSTFTLNVENLASIIDKWLKKMSTVLTADELEQSPVADVLLQGLIDTFPCSRPTP